MSLITKILSSLYFFNSLTSEPTMPTDTAPGVTEYERIIMVSKQNYSPQSTDLIDPNHEGMMATGIFDEADTLELDLEAVAKLMVQYGIDLNPETNPEVQVYPDGKRLIPGKALMVPVKYGDTEGQPWVIAIDTANPQRAYKWFQLEYATIIVLQMDYIVPQGFEKEGLRVMPNSIFYQGYLVHAKANQDMGIEENREIYKYSCTQLIPLQSNYLDELAYYSVIDKFNREGLGVSFTTANMSDGSDQVEGRITLTWKNPSDL